MDSPLLNLKAAAFAMAVAALAATAEAAAAGGSAIPTADFLLSPTFLWVAANAIIIWLVSSSRRRGSRTNAEHAAAAAAGHDGGEAALHDAAVDGLYTSASEYEAFSDAASGSARRAFDDAQATSKRLAREARAAARRAGRPRVRKKPAAPGHLQDAAASPRDVAAAEAEAKARELYREIRRREEATAAAAAAAAAEPMPGPGGDGGDEEEDVSMDSLWESIVQRRAARPVAVQKSESWGNDELPRLQRVAETAAATRRREMRKSVSAVSNKAAPAPAEAATQREEAAVAMRNLGWRTRDVLVSISPDELLRRAESFIRRQHEHLRLQRQESEQRQLQLRRRLHAGGGPALIRV
ncbi:unnamed protein product [Urochloa decumbens]|uniref:Uncharacterized protein n=1 Tax=Urochloa decumbens TaxID=240449 RepID=A0ABC8XYZ6_9POAL